MEKRTHLIIGCGSAALSAVEAIRRFSKGDEITVVTAEKHRPYSPTALPYLLSARIHESELWMRPHDYFDRLRVRFDIDREVVEVIPLSKMVCYRDGSSDNYDRLLIATGASPARPPIKGLPEVGFLGFRTLNDYRALEEQLRNKRRVTILGAGLVAMELAMGLVEKGYQVDVVARSRILRAYFEDEAEGFIRDVFQREGTNLIGGQQPIEIRRNGSRIEVVLDTGDSIATDALVTATGVQANTGFLKESGIEVREGVLVDRNMRTNVSDVYAAGDVAEGPDFFTSDLGLNQILPGAVAQGRVAGSSMVGEEASYDGGIAMNVFNFFGHVAFSVGLSTTTDSRYRILKQVDQNRKEFRKLVLDGDRLVGVTFLNVDAEPGLFLYLIRNKVIVDRHADGLLEHPRDVSRWLMLRNEQREIGLAGE